MKRWAAGLIVVFAFCGLAVSNYIDQSERQGAPLICNVASLDGCNIVVTSAYAQLLGMPLATWGILFYTFVFVIAAFELFLMNQMLRWTLQVLAAVGLLVSLYGIYTQVFLIEALCMYCLVSAVVAMGIFIAALFIEPVPIHHLKRARAALLKS